jgi:hypothetical protein
VFLPGPQGPRLAGLQRSIPSDPGIRGPLHPRRLRCPPSPYRGGYASAGRLAGRGASTLSVHGLFRNGPLNAEGLCDQTLATLRPPAAIPLDANSPSLHRPLEEQPASPRVPGRWRIHNGEHNRGARRRGSSERGDECGAGGGPATQRGSRLANHAGMSKDWERTAWHFRWTQPGSRVGSRA